MAIWHAESRAHDLNKPMQTLIKQNFMQSIYKDLLLTNSSIGYIIRIEKIDVSKIEILLNGNHDVKSILGGTVAADVFLTIPPCDSKNVCSQIFSLR